MCFIFWGVNCGSQHDLKKHTEQIAEREVNTKLADPLSQVLDRLRLIPWSTGITPLDNGWVVATPPGLVSFYVAAEGNFDLIYAEGDACPVTVEEGSYVLLAHGTPHTIYTRPGTWTTTWPEAYAQMTAARNGSGGAHAATIVRGHFLSHSLGTTCFDGIFPVLARLDGRSKPELARCVPLLNLMLEESQGAQAGWQTVVTEIVRTLFTQFVRAFASETQFAERNGNHGNWVRGALDDTIGPILTLLHDSPERPWTVSMLARRAHMAKSAFSERFRQTVGQPPLKYLTEYRVKLACQLLQDSDFSIKEISASVGYESASSFSNAFKRWIGKSPADYRRAGTALDEALQEA